MSAIAQVLHPQPTGLPSYGRQRRSDRSKIGQAAQILIRARQRERVTPPSRRAPQMIAPAIRTRRQLETEQPSRLTSSAHSARRANLKPVN